MIASPEQLEKIADIISRLDSTLAAENVENRRRAPRITLRTAITIILLSGIAPTSIDIFSRNFSASGIGFVCKRLFRPDERVAIPLRMPRLPPKLVLARITFGRYIGRGLYEMGAEFLECVTDISGTAPIERSIPNRWLQVATHSPPTPIPPADNPPTAADPSAPPTAPTPATAPAATPAPVPAP